MIDTGQLPTRAQLEWMYEFMCTATEADRRAAAEVRAARLQAAFYPIRGLEAACAGLGLAMEAQDHMVSTYRNLGDALAKGMALRTIVAEAYGRVGGCSNGKGGTMHLADASVGMMATTGIVGSGLPIAAGLGVAAQLDGTSRAVVVTFGDGATSIGAAHEALNLAALWKLPVLFVCQNNQWAEHTPISTHVANPNLAEKAASYGMTAESVDGFDPIAVWLASRRALESIRSGGGPVFLEFRTYRLTGHTGTADYSYVPKQELEEALRRDPAPALRRWLVENDLVDASRLDEIEKRAQSAVDDAFEFAVGSAAPAQATLLTDVFANGNEVMA